MITEKKARERCQEPNMLPREKLLALGAKSLSDQELLAIFLRTGLPGRPVMQLAKDLLECFGSIYQLVSADYQEFCRHRGLGLCKFTQLQASVELSRRYFNRKLTHLSVLLHPEATQEYLKTLLMHREREVFLVLFLDNHHRLIIYEEMFTGTFNSVDIYPREIVRSALKWNAAAVILAHNHPSGSAEPSSADRTTTKKVLEVCELLEIRLLDHIIIAEGESLSFAEKGWL